MTPCPLCGRASDGWLLEQAQQVTPPVAEILQQRSPGWTREKGACPHCVLQAAREHARARSAFSLHTRTQPHTTFPYYHPEDESVLGLPERLPDYFTLLARGVGIAFLDSGFFPHPDLCALPPPPQIEWERLTPARIRKTIEKMEPRYIDYVDLTAGGESRGMTVKSLWAGDALSWHGQMTTTIAAGNGALSGGRYRGFASRAQVLPIRVGRGDGRIPESDILAGFEWLLKRRRWQRLGVRVLNVSVGGDFPQDWRFNPVSLAAQRLSDEGVLIVSAAGNRPIDELLPPAQTPSAITAGGFDDHNRRAFSDSVFSGENESPILYPHNFGTIRNLPYRNGSAAATTLPRAGKLTSESLNTESLNTEVLNTEVLGKPELLAPARYLPSPLLPVHSAFRETHAIARLRATLRENDVRAETLVEHWQRVLRGEMVAEEVDRVRHPIAGLALEDETTAEWMADIWQPIRKRMNAQKWTHAAYQHVDGTSVSAAVISSVAAQMVEANPALTPPELKDLLCSTALASPHFPAERSGAGMIQPAAAVAAALRSAAGRLAGYPCSGTVLLESELRKWRDLLTIGTLTGLDAPASDDFVPVYFGLLAPDAERVTWLGETNGWQVDANPLQQGRNGWWHTVLLLPVGSHSYRFHVRSGEHSRWCADPESTHRTEGGYTQPDGDHSMIFLQ